MNPSDVWLGDAVAAHALLGPNDAALGERIFALLGLDVANTDETVDDVALDDSPPLDPDSPSPIEPNVVVEQRPAPRAAPKPPPATTIPVLEPVSSGHAASSPWSRVPELALQDATPKRRPREPRPLFELPAARHLLTEIVATHVPGSSLDIGRAVELMATGRVLREIPYLAERSVRRGVQLLLDRSRALEAHHAEQRDAPTETGTSSGRTLEGALCRIVGRGKVSALGFTELPLERAGSGPMSGWKRYELPEPGTPVLAVTDVGIGGNSMAPPNALVAEWNAFADRLATRGSSLTLLIPYPPDRWPPELRPPLRAVPWTDRTTVRSARSAVLGRRQRLPRRTAPAGAVTIPPGTGDSAELIERIASSHPLLVELAELLAPAVRVEPSLLRWMRLGAAPHIDAGVESDLWLSPLVRASDEGGFSFDGSHAAELRRRLAERWRHTDQQPALRAARDILDHAHDGHSAATRLEEQIAWLAVVGDDDAIESKLAPAIAALINSGRSSLRYWAAQASARLPPEAHGTGSGWALLQFGSAQTKSAAQAPAGVPIEHVLATLPKERLLVRHNGSSVEAGALSGTGLCAIDVPRTSPVVVELDGRTYTIASGETITHAASGVVTLVTAAGATYRIEPPTPGGVDLLRAVVSITSVFSKRPPAAGFFVAHDVVVAHDAVEHTEDVAVAWMGRELRGRVVAQHGGLVAIRLQRPEPDAVFVPVDARRFDEPVAWTGASVDEGSVRAVSGTWSPDSGASLADDAPAGTPMVAQNRLLGVLIGADAP